MKPGSSGAKEYIENFKNEKIKDDLALRDYFAIHADTSDYQINEYDLAFELTKIDKPKNYPDGIESLEWSLALEAKLRYKFADAMMEARNGNS
jgi:hypothetical protein